MKNLSRVTAIAIIVGLACWVLSTGCEGRMEQPFTESIPSAGDITPEEVPIGVDETLPLEEVEEEVAETEPPEEAAEEPELTGQQVAEIIPPEEDEFDDDYFGRSVSISGDYAIVGAPLSNASGLDAGGAAYILRRQGDGWASEATLLTAGDDAVENARFGSSVAIDGDYAIVGAYRENDLRGAAYVFHRQDDTWNKVARLTKPMILLTAYKIEFGTSVDISGDYAIIGARSHDIFFPPKQNVGSAFIFQRVEDSWNYVAYFKEDSPEEDAEFGTSVTISGDFAIVGAPGSDDSGVTDGGAVFVFKREGDEWNQVAVLTADANAQTYAEFGTSVAMDGDRAIVGTPGEDKIFESEEDDGAAYIFHREGDSWALEKRVIPSVQHHHNYFGLSVAIAGNHAVIGAPSQTVDLTQDGTAYLFMRSESDWEEVKMLVSDTSKENSNFGYSVSLDENFVVVGQPFDVDDPKTGAVYIFK